MALGDYSRTTYVNGTAPAINATNLNNQEAKTKELDTFSYTFVGAMIMYAGSTAPSGWLLCNGQAVSRSTYSALFSAIGTIWGTGDGSTTFNVPDMRESAPVGVGTYSAVTGTTHGAITAHDAFTLGGFKDDQGQGHWHKINDTANYQSTYLSIKGTGAAGVEYATFDSGDTARASIQVSDGPNGTPRVGTITRGKRIGVNFIIKY